MTIPRVVALAQALAMIMILVPGPQPSGPAPALAATGSGVGCETGADRFRGPRSPGDPPWPPGAEPTPTPEPSLEPSPSPTADAAADTPTVFLAATGVRVAQVDPTLQPTPAPTLEPAQPTPTPTQQADAPLISGIDVSHHNGDIDFGRVRDAGYEFVFLKTTQDNDFIDPMFATNLARARAAGLAAGGYHFFDYTLDGDVQADHFLDRLEAAGGLDDTLPPVIDVECWSPIGLSIHAVSAARLRDLVARVYERTGRLPMIYTSVLMWKEVVGNADGFEDLPLWAACWDCEAPPSIAPGWDGWTFWQTGLDRIPGVGSLDGNVFRGDIEDLDLLRSRPLTIEGGAEATASRQVAIDLGGRSGTHMRTSPDGQDWSRWRAIRGTPRAELGSGEGSHTLHVQLRDRSRLKSPVFSDSIVLDTSGPRLSAPTVRLGLAPLGPGATGESPDPGSVSPSPGLDASSPADGQGIPIEVGWEASDVVAGLADASLSVDCDDGPAALSEVPGTAEAGQTTTWAAPAVVVPGARCEVTVTARDGVGNATRARSDTVVATIIAASGEGDAGVSLEGRQVGVIARRGPDLGRAAVLIDGEPVGLVDLYAPLAGGPEIVHVVDLSAGSPASIMLEPTGTSHADSTGTAVIVDGFVTLTEA